LTNFKLQIHFSSNRHGIIKGNLGSQGWSQCLPTQYNRPQNSWDRFLNRQHAMTAFSISKHLLGKASISAKLPSEHHIGDALIALFTL
jgi:hypothetical protein